MEKISCTDLQIERKLNGGKEINSSYLIRDNIILAYFYRGKFIDYLNCT